MPAVRVKVPGPGVATTTKKCIWFTEATYIYINRTHTYSGLTSSSTVSGRASALCVLPALPVSPHTSSHGQTADCFHASHQLSNGPITDEDDELGPIGRTGRRSRLASLICHS